jgi:hypothetical protein
VGSRFIRFHSICVHLHPSAPICAECLSEVPGDMVDVVDVVDEVDVGRYDGRKVVGSSHHLQLDQGALTTYLKRVCILPPSGSIERIVKFSHGQSNPTFLIQMTSGSGPGALEECVLRKKPSGQILPSAHAIEREYRVLVRTLPVAGWQWTQLAGVGPGWPGACSLG